MTQCSVSNLMLGIVLSETPCPTIRKFIHAVATCQMTMSESWSASQVTNSFPHSLHFIIQKRNLSSQDNNNTNHIYLIIILCCCNCRNQWRISYLVMDKKEENDNSRFNWRSSLYYLGCFNRQDEA